MTATFRLYEELNDFLPPARRKMPLALLLEPDDTVAACLGRLGVPQAAVDLVLLDGVSVGLDHPVPDGARVAVYPVFESFDVGPLAQVPGRPLRRLRFAAAPALAGLIEALRRRGLEARVMADAGPEEQARVAARGEVLLVRDPGPALGQGFPRVLRVGSDDPAAQAAEVLARLHLEARDPRPGGV